MSTSKITGYVLISLAIIVVIVVAYRNSNNYGVPVIFSARDMVNATWSQYKDIYFEKGTMRTLDTSRNNVTTSEAESYALLRSVWLDDHVSFDGSWQWTKDNLQQKNSALFSWLFGEQSPGKHGILTQMNGQNAASDADSDIALALLFASKRWQEKTYHDEAIKILNDMWAREVVVIQGRPYLAADDTDHTKSTYVVLNPSYFSPYAYRIFAQVDPGHNWTGLIDSSYDVLNKTLTSTLDKKKSANIPPDWVLINRNTGAILATQDSRYSTNYSYDAMRIPWRLMLDYEWYQEPRAKKLLANMEFLNKEWTSNGVIHSSYAHDGAVVETAESPAIYGGTLPVLMIIDKGQAKKMYEDKLLALFSPDNQTWKQPIGYYNENWVWFGIALYNNFLPNLWEGADTRQVTPTEYK